MTQSDIGTRSRARRRAVRILLAGALAVAALPPAASGQEDDREAVMAVIDRLFDAMRANDADGVRSAFAEGAMLISTEAPDGSPRTSYIPVEGFANAVGSATVSWDEPYWDPVIQIQDHLASVWIKYAFYAGEEFSHCGVDAVLLARGADGWKIVALADTREQANCELPPDSRPFDP